MPIARGMDHTGDVTKQERDFWNTKSKAFFGRTAGGTHLQVFNDSRATPALTGRTSFRYQLKYAGGAWSAEKMFYEAGIKNSSPALIEAAPGRFSRDLRPWDQGPLAHPHPLREIRRLRPTLRFLYR